MNRLLILLAYLNKEATNVSWNEANINESLKEIYGKYLPDKLLKFSSPIKNCPTNKFYIILDYKWLTTNQTRNLLMSTHKEYSTSKYSLIVFTFRNVPRILQYKRNLFTAADKNSLSFLNAVIYCVQKIISQL